MGRKYIVENICQTKKGVELTVSGKRFLLSLNDYTDAYYYPNKELSEPEFQSLKEKSQLKSASDYLSKALPIKRYTIREISDKLKERFHLDEKKVSALITPYIQCGFLNDSSYALDYCESKVEQGYGKNLILSKLREKGISDAILHQEKILALFEKENQSLLSSIQKEDQKKKDKTLQQKKASLYSLLLRRGFSSEAIRANLDAFYSNRTEEEKRTEREIRASLLKKEAQKCYNSLTRKAMPAKQKQDSFIRRLISKGFRFDEIEPFIKEYSFHD